MLNVNKLLEIHDLCGLNREDFFFFISGSIENGVCFQFPVSEDIVKEKDDLFYSFLSEYNYWGTKNWFRYVSGGVMSDIQYEDNIIDISHEIIVFHKNKINEIAPIYEEKYKGIISILECEDSIIKILQMEHYYLLLNNVYITNASIDYIKNQIL